MLDRCRKLEKENAELRAEKDTLSKMAVEEREVAVIELSEGEEQCVRGEEMVETEEDKKDAKVAKMLPPTLGQRCFPVSVCARLL